MTGLGVRTSGPQMDKVFLGGILVPHTWGVLVFAKVFVCIQDVIKLWSYSRNFWEVAKCRLQCLFRSCPRQLKVAVSNRTWRKIVCDINLRYKPLSVLVSIVTVFPSFLYKVSELKNRLLWISEKLLCVWLSISIFLTWLLQTMHRESFFFLSCMKPIQALHRRN